MIRKTLIALAVFVLIGTCVFGAGMLADGSVGIPQAIAEDSPCPATRCASGECHGFEAVPEPDGLHEMTCPEATCTSAECHAWETLVDRYYQPSDMSLNVWILAPVALVVGLILLVRKL
ncbi:hypothetical protein [Raoultibacter phocaeensis]|uniref:hypothetical protein n=1 Tax=Raoultibacter phocaeensis TaxID=2479841 RepID=UPI0011192A90|nr:hypothetical protein [Raoultibacter phocaeensis]